MLLMGVGGEDKSVNHSSENLARECVLLLLLPAGLRAAAPSAREVSRSGADDSEARAVLPSPCARRANGAATKLVGGETGRGKKKGEKLNSPPPGFNFENFYSAAASAVSAVRPKATRASSGFTTGW